jgi:DNA repair exonuclease SbcCD ATPase subunit
VDIDDLYGAPLERFVPERTELAKALRKEGHREQAAEVAARRKPSVAAWAVNQLIRTQGRSVQDLFGAGDALRHAHEQAASGRGDAQALRKATQDERAAVDTLLESARGLLTSDGHELSPAVIDRVADTLRAAALDPDARSQVSEGRLERELRHVGLGFLGDTGAAPAPAPKRKAPAAKRKQEDQKQKAQDEARERERAQAVRDARAAEKEARRELERAQRAADSAQARRDKAAAALADAERELADAQAQAKAATAAHDQAAEALARIQTQ